MKKVACLFLVGALGLFGCGGGSGDDDDDITFPADADTATPDSGDDGACNAVAQTGCAADEKCSLILDDPGTHVGCVADGTQALGEECTPAAVAGASDNCAQGGYCYNGTCREICTVFNDTCAGECADFVDADGNPIPIEWCLDGCDPVVQNCPTANEACYISDGGGICLGHDEVLPGDACTFTNDCAAGSQCLGRTGEPSLCRSLCGTIEEIWYVNVSVDPPELGFPTCCGPNCDAVATLSCPGLNEMCWLIGDGADGVLDVGFCQTDEESSNPTGTPAYACDCQRTPVEGTNELCEVLP